MVLFGIILAALAFAGGSALTFFLMDEPRRRALRMHARIEQERVDLEQYRGRLETTSAQLDTREYQIAGFTREQNQRASTLAAQITDFEKRAVSYDELVRENQKVKTDLKNVAVHMAHQDCVRHEQQQELMRVSILRDRLGRAYFDEVYGVVRKAITPSNYVNYKQRFRSSAAFVREAGFDLPTAEEERILAELHMLYERAVRVAVEREEQALLRDQMREEQRQAREAQDAVEQAERERQAIAMALQEALADVSGRHAEEIGRRAEEVERLRLQLAEAEAKSQRAISMAQITKEGHVYVISNIGAFGAGVYKIGMTRRKEPLDRVRELGDASVPFPFDVHMTIKCDDAPKLESTLHRAFHKHRVNRINLRKEFFRASLDDIVKAAREAHGEVEYVADAEALEYMSSLKVTDEQLTEIEQAFAKAEEALEDEGEDGELQ